MNSTVNVELRLRWQSRAWRQLHIPVGDNYISPSDVDGYIAKAFGIFVSSQEEDVEILFDAEIAWRVEERTFHPDERKARRPDGVLHYSIRTSAQWEIIPWVQSFGALAELVAPVSWRSSVRSNAAAMLARYGA